MSATRNGTTSESSPELTELAHRITEIDTPIDSRDCPHDCGGTLTVEDDTVICSTCRCTPDGVYIDPPERTWVKQSRGWLFSRPNPKGERLETWPPDERERYRGSNETRMVGAYSTSLFDADDDERPDSVTDEYTFELPLLSE